MGLHIVGNQPDQAAEAAAPTAALENPTLNHLSEVLHDAVAWLAHEQISYFLIGAVAEALLWRPRLTRQIEVMAVLSEANLFAKLESSKRFALEIEASETPENCTVFLRHGLTLAGVAITACSTDFERQAVRHALRVELNGLALRIATPEDHLLLQTRQGLSDIDDLEEVLRSYPQADRAYLLRYLTKTPHTQVAARMASMLRGPAQPQASNFPHARSLARI